uniref:WASP like actin nucleation promoting factor a n=1 Tax=Petromyzon marinus TaxID=7757 RepID=S4RY60_PETMA
TLASTVVQLLYGVSGKWDKQCCGVVCFVKDNSKRSFFITIYDICTENCKLWEQELYTDFVYYAPKADFHTFIGDKCQVGLNFTDVEEAHFFYNSVQAKLDKQKQRQTKSATKLTEQPSMPEMHPVPLPVMKVPNAAPAPALAKYHKQKTKSKTPLTKDQIGEPSHFKHIGHVGWDPNCGFTVAENVDPHLKQLFYMAGINDSHLQDKRLTRKISQIIKDYGGMEGIKQEIQQVPVPKQPAQKVPGPGKPPEKHLAPSMAPRDHKERSHGRGPPPPPPLRSRGLTEADVGPEPSR